MDQTEMQPSDYAPDQLLTMVSAFPQMLLALELCERMLRRHMASTDSLAGRECLLAMNQARLALDMLPNV